MWWSWGQEHRSRAVAGEAACWEKLKKISKRDVRLASLSGHSVSKKIEISPQMHRKLVDY